MGAFSTTVSSSEHSVLASFTSYVEAQATVDTLADRHFEVEGLAIVARDLQVVEQVTGRQNAGRAALQGALSGAGGGALLGFFFGLFDLATPVASGLALVFWGAIIGAVVGGLINLLSHLLMGGRRDFSSVSAMHAGHYDVIARPHTVARARQLLAEGASPTPQPR